ncbi:MAG: DJ-1/PfpI family protein, partial [Longispora sp.]|nr:DJ-1/PfpI family protein [Longispora sp. (in: high G+C Gram-positive bacteria)]
MAKDLKGKKVAFLVADGVEQVELDKPWEAVSEAGAQPELISLSGGKIQAFNHWDRSEVKNADVSLDDANAADYDALVLPGGVINGDLVRADKRAVAFTKTFVESGKPVAAICHGLWVLAEA